MAAASASALARFLTLIGAIVMLRITVMFWNRLYCWNTIDILSRSAFSFRRCL